MTLPFPQKLPTPATDMVVLVGGYLSLPDAEQTLIGISQQGATIAPHLIQRLPHPAPTLPRSLYSPPVPTRIGPMVQLQPGALSLPDSKWGGLVDWVAGSVDYPMQPLRGWLHWQNPAATLRSIYMLFTTATVQGQPQHMTVLRTWDITDARDRAKGVASLWDTAWEGWGL